MLPPSGPDPDRSEGRTPLLAQSSGGVPCPHLDDGAWGECQRWRRRGSSILRIVASCTRGPWMKRCSGSWGTSLEAGGAKSDRVWVVHRGTPGSLHRPGPARGHELGSVALMVRSQELTSGPKATSSYGCVRRCCSGCCSSCRCGCRTRPRDTGSFLHGLRKFGMVPSAAWREWPRGSRTSGAPGAG